ncbi:MAG: hypothetical protein Q7U74_15330 [Saprospiraceae bacterium]|nr:hypothetical protein [Saprospiraceae bacterium]
MKKEKIIPAIHNYCDRWCERCVFIERCAVGLEELKRWNRDTPMTEDEMWAAVSDNFKESLRMLDEMLEEAGIDPAELEMQPEPIPETDLDKLETEIFEKGIIYFKLSNAFFNTNQAFLQEQEAEVKRMTEMNLPIDLDQLGQIQDALEVIQQYASFIGVKARRAISGMQEMHDTSVWGDPPYQSDANGSAKSCLLCIDRSLSAWEMLRKIWPEKTDEILDLLVALSRFRKELAALFPDWEKFVRPGFDTEPMQVRRFEMN